MACELKLESCTRSCGCTNCPHNINEVGSYIGSAEWQQECDRINKEYQDKKNLERKHFIKGILPQCVFPLINVDGVGFFIKDHFVTCGHCLKDGYVKIVYEGRELILRKEDALVYLTIDPKSVDEQYGDIAIFPAKGIRNFLKIGAEPDEFKYTVFDKQLMIATIEHKCDYPMSDNVSPIFAPPMEKFELTTSNAKELSIIGHTKKEGSYVSNFFEVCTNKLFSHGASGSPIFNEDNEVLGLLIGCLNPESEPYRILFHPLARYEYGLGLY